MKLFLDTADIDEIRTVARWGVLDGVTTNPSLFAKVTGKTYDEVLRRSARSPTGRSRPRSSHDDVDGMLKEGRHFAKIATTSSSRWRCRRPASRRSAASGPRASRPTARSSSRANQGLLAAKAGASLLSPFVGRLDDINEEGMVVIRELSDIITLPRDRFRGAVGLHPPPATRHRVGARRRACRDAAVQDLPADDPSPADRQGHRPIPEGLGRRPCRDRQGLTDPGTSPSR